MKNTMKLEHLNQPYDNVVGMFHLVNVETIHNNENGRDYTFWTTNDGNVHIWETDFGNFVELVETNREIMDCINNGEIITYEITEGGGHIVDDCIFP